MKKTRHIALPSDEEDAKITAAALTDPDNPPLTEERLSRMVPARDIPKYIEQMNRATVGPTREIRSNGIYQLIGIKEDIAERLTRNGEDLELCVNETLRKAVGL